MYEKAFQSLYELSEQINSKHKRTCPNCCRVNQRLYMVVVPHELTYHAISICEDCKEKYEHRLAERIREVEEWQDI